MNFDFCWWFVLCRIFVMVRICNICLRKMFDTNTFLVFHRFGDIITVYALYNRISKIYNCKRFRFGGCRFFGNYSGLGTIIILSLTCRVTDKILVFIRLVSLSSIYLSSSILKRLRDAKLLLSLLPNVLSFVVFLRVTNFSVWLLSLPFLFWKYSLLYFEFSISFWIFVPLLQSSCLRNSIWLIKLLINASFSLFVKIYFSSDFLLSIHIWSNTKVFNVFIPTWQPSILYVVSY